MPTPLMRSLNYCIIIFVLNVCIFHGSSAFVPQWATTNYNNNHQLLARVSSPTRVSIHVAAAAAAASGSTPSSSSSRKQNHHEKWQPNYDAMAAYQKSHGHCEVTMEENPALSIWLEDQRKSYRQMKLGRKTKLTKKRAIALEMIGAIPTELLDLSTP